MELKIRLANQSEKVTNIAIADAILRLCEEYFPNTLNPKKIAKVILACLESEDEE